MAGSYVVVAKYRVTAGQQALARDLLLRMRGHAREEPGCQQYEVHGGTKDDTEFLLYERYRSVEDFEAHKASPAFKELILEGVWPLIEDRHATFWELFDP